MAKKATIGNRMTPAPRALVTRRETPGQTAKRALTMAGPVTVTRFTPGTVPAPTVPQKRAGHLAYGVTTSGTRNQPREWRVVRTESGAFVKAEYHVKGGLVVVRKMDTPAFKGWIGQLVLGGKATLLCAVTRDQVIDPSKIQDEARRISLRVAAQIGHGEL